MRKIDTQTGARQRSVNIKTILETAKVPGFAKPTGVDIIKRTYDQGLGEYLSKMTKQEILLYNRKMLTGPETQVLAQDDNNGLYHGVNYASADYLGLAQHPNAKQAAVEAIQKYGISSGNTPSGLGSNVYYLQLQKELEEYWNTNILIFSTGWMAGFGGIQGLVRKSDHVIMDQLSHNCLQQGAMAATKNIKKFKHLDQAGMVEILAKTRQENPNDAILVVTEGLFSMDADSPDVVFYQKITKQHNAFLLIDCAHDFGHLGDKGQGIWEVQGLKDFSNVILVGTGSKCLSTNIGFIGIKDKRILELMRYMSAPYVNATVINPVQAATSLAQLRILNSIEGYQRRKKVVENYNYLRARLQKIGTTIFGNPCAIMPVFVGNQVVCRLVSRIMMDRGVHVNGIEYPVVKIGQARLRVSLMPQHTREHLDKFFEVFEFSLKQANEIYERQLKVFNDEMSQSTEAKL